MEQCDVSKQNVLALSYIATEDINDAADVIEVLKTVFLLAWLAVLHVST